VYLPWRGKECLDRGETGGDVMDGNGLPVDADSGDWDRARWRADEEGIPFSKSILSLKAEE